MAGLRLLDVGYISLHGAATKTNDAIEAQVVSRIFGNVPCSSLKHLTGHTPGTAGICGLIIAMLVLRDGLDLPRQDFSRSPPDPALAPPRLCPRSAETPKIRRHVQFLCLWRE